MNLDNWRANGEPSAELETVVGAVILATANGSSSSDRDAADKLARNYFVIHKMLTDKHLLNHEEAVAFLSYSFLLVHLSSVERLSAAQISNLLSKRDQRANFSRQAVASVLSKLGIAPNLDLKQVKLMHKRDASQELLSFADADLQTSAELVAQAAANLGYPGDILKFLETISPSFQASNLVSSFTPYLQILHYQCCVAEIFDHAVTDIYEFTPRGGAALWLFDQYPNSISSAANPFLNNAKAVEVLDPGWVRSKKDRERPGALALLSILEGMQKMGFAARRELAWWIRLWLHRIIRLAGTTANQLPTALSDTHVMFLLQSISRENSATFGILEQRLVDALAASKHPELRSRGLGDSVNATNLSRAKLGDCEFLDTASLTLIAYEAHAGKLTELYVRAHLATLKKSMRRRVEELNVIADSASWVVRIVFVAHVIGENIPDAESMNGLDIQIECITFEEFCAIHEEVFPRAITESFNLHFLAPLQQRRTPNDVRNKLNDLLATLA